MKPGTKNILAVSIAAVGLLIWTLVKNDGYSEDDRSKFLACCTAYLSYLYDTGEPPKNQYMGDSGEPSLSWRVCLLPYFGYRSGDPAGFGPDVDKSSPWNAVSNRKVDEHVGQLPFFASSGTSRETSVFALNADAVESLDARSLMAEPNRLLLVRSVTNGVHWMQPGDLVAGTGQATEIRTNSTTLRELAARSSSLFALFADGTAWVVTGRENCRKFAELVAPSGRFHNHHDQLDRMATLLMDLTAD